MESIDYKELYEATFKYAKQLYDAGSYDNETLEAIFPKLKESDDESIRKSITEFFKNYSENGTWKAIPDVTKWVAWLEKQGEQKPIEWTMQDEEELQIALDTLVKAGQHSSAKWLKNVCLVPQSQWKPTERMLEALKWAKCEFHPDCPETMEQLKYLYQELKQLYYDRT